MAPPDDQAEAVADDDDALWRVRILAAIVFVLVAIAATAHAEPLDEQIDATTQDAPRKKARVRDEPKPAPIDLRSMLAQQLADEAASIDRALVMVTGKLAEIDTARTRRLAAAYRLLQAAPQDDRMATARRRAAAHVLIERDVTERRILVAEATQLRGAATRTTADTGRVAELALPPPIGRPARGQIARRFGTLQHDRSKATLARRGLDFEVEARAAVVAPADGTVRYAGPIRGLDTGVIIDHGTYMTVIAKLGELVVPVGAPIARGDRVGRAARHRVYLEVRVKLGPGGHPIDPEPLLEPQKRR